MKILNDDSDDIYFEQFKGAYIEQHPEVVQVIEQIIKKYGLVKYPNKFVSVEMVLFIYFLTTTLSLI